MRVIGVREIATTETNIQKIYGQLQKHAEAVAAKAYRDDVTIPQRVVQMAGGNMKRARVIWVKLNLKKEVPATFLEAVKPGGTIVSTTDLPPNPTYVSALTGLKQADGASVILPEQESAVCLYLALNQLHGGAATNSESIFNPSELIPTNKPEVKIPKDAWGRALLFCRWPSEDFELNPVGLTSAPPWRDPDDPTGLLSDPSWTDVQGRGDFKTLCHPVDAGKSLKLMPVIVSGGRDKNLGLVNLQTLRADATHAKDDNIYSYRLRLGGKSN
jgi:hypothetical protein